MFLHLSPHLNAKPDLSHIVPKRGMYRSRLYFRLHDHKGVPGTSVNRVPMAGLVMTGLNFQPQPSDNDGGGSSLSSAMANTFKKK